MSPRPIRTLILSALLHNIECNLAVLVVVVGLHYSVSCTYIMLRGLNNLFVVAVVVVIVVCCCFFVADCSFIFRLLGAQKNISSAWVELIS